MSNKIATKKNQELLKIALAKDDIKPSNTKAGSDSRRAQNDSHIRLHAKRGGLYCGSRKKD